MLMRNHLVETRKGLTCGAAMVLCADMADIDEALAKAQRAITSAKDLKMRQRYPDGFNTEASVARRDEAP